MGQEHASIAVAFMLQLGPLAMLLSPFISAASAGEAAMTRAALRKIRRFIGSSSWVEVLRSSRGRQRRADPATGQGFYHLCRLGAREKMTDDSKNQVPRSEEHTSELQSLTNLVCRLLLEKK